ncbi:MAG: hypothetical protein M0R77_12815 [Gammaproteobacteria bacterium]|nr:hypothetical protein [Gammaproteobacteria bacterium]
MANIRCTTTLDGRMFHTFESGGKTHVLGVVRSTADVKACRRVNILQSRSLASEGLGG